MPRRGLRLPSVHFGLGLSKLTCFPPDVQTPKEATQSLAELGTILFARQKGGTRTGSRSTIGSCTGYGDFALLTRPWDGLLEAAVDSSRHLLEIT
jgi:hypothetical protein